VTLGVEPLLNSQMSQRDEVERIYSEHAAAVKACVMRRAPAAVADDASRTCSRCAGDDCGMFLRSRCRGRSGSLPMYCDRTDASRRGAIDYINA